MKFHGAALLLLSGLCVTVQAFTGERYFENRDSAYTFGFWYETSLDRDSVMNILYDFTHLERYGDDSRNMRLIRQEKDWYEIEIRIQFLFYDSRSIYIRKKNSETGSIDIDLVSYSQNNDAMPPITRSHASYRLHCINGITSIEYEQKVTFDRTVNWIYMRVVKKKLNDFTDDLIRYLDKMALSTGKTIKSGHVYKGKHCCLEKSHHDKKKGAFRLLFPKR